MFMYTIENVSRKTRSDLKLTNLSRWHIEMYVSPIRKGPIEAIPQLWSHILGIAVPTCEEGTFGYNLRRYDGTHWRPQRLEGHQGGRDLRRDKLLEQDLREPSSKHKNNDSNG